MFLNTDLLFVILFSVTILVNISILLNFNFSHVFSFDKHRKKSLKKISSIALLYWISRQMNVKASNFYVPLLLCLLTVQAEFKYDESAQRNQNPCCSMPCQHRGVCTPISSLYYECDCPKGYYGATCEKSTITRWILDKLNFAGTEKHRLTTTGKLMWGVINNIPPLHGAALRYFFLSSSDFASQGNQIWQNYPLYSTLDFCYNQSCFTRGLPSVPKECPTPLGVKGPRILPQIEEVFALLLKRREFKPCPIGTNLMFVTFGQHLSYQLFKTNAFEEEGQDVRDSYESTRALRSWVKGKLKTRIINGEEYPPYLEDAPGVYMHYPRKKNGKEVFPKWAMSHKMLNKTPLIFAMTTIWLREHNRVCDIIAEDHPDWNDERIFQTARWIILGELLTITAEEYFQHLMQSKLRLKYRPQLFHREVVPSSDELRYEFGLTFQWDHMLPDIFVVQGMRHNFSDVMFGSNRIVFEHGLDAIIDSMSRHPAGEVTFRNCGKACEKILKQLIEEGRKTRLHSLNDYRRFYGLKPYESFREMVGNEEIANALEKLYGEVDAVEFVVGIFMEKRDKSVLSPTAVHLAVPVALREILNNPIGSPSLWRPSTFGGKRGFEIVKKATLRKLFCLNLRGNCRNNVWVSFKTPADVTAFSRKINSALTQKK